MSKEPTFLSKFPVAIREKKHSKINSINGKIKHFKDKQSFKFKSRYGYFAINSKGNVDFIIVLVDKENKINYKIKIAKQHIYDSLMLFLEYRPIERKTKRNKEFYIHNNNKLYNIDDDFDKLTPPEILERYNNVKNSLVSLIKDNSNDNRKRTAELQLERLIEQNWKMELLYEIYKSEKCVADMEF